MSGQMSMAPTMAMSESISRPMLAISMAMMRMHRWSNRRPSKTLADHVVGRATLANVECALEEAGDVFHGFARQGGCAWRRWWRSRSRLICCLSSSMSTSFQRGPRARCHNPTPWRAGCLLDAESDRADDGGANAVTKLNSIPREYMMHQPQM